MDDNNHFLEKIYFEQRRQLFACAVAVTHCPERAEDAIHDAFCRLAARPAVADDLKAYVFRAVRNAAIDQLRRQRRPVQELDETIFDPGPGPDDLASDNEFKTRVAAALGRLREDERETIIQHLWGDLTFREIAAVRGVPQGTVATWYRRGLDHLREFLED